MRAAHRRPVTVKVGSPSSDFRFRALMGTSSSDPDSSSSSLSSAQQTELSVFWEMVLSLEARARIRTAVASEEVVSGILRMLVTVELWRRGRPDTEATAAFAGRRSRPPVGRPRRRLCSCCFCGLGFVPLLL